MSLLLVAALLSGCKPAGDAAAALSVSPDHVDAGTVAVGESVSTTITLSNTGGGAIALLSASLTEGDPGVWSVARDGFDDLSGSTVTTLTVTFAPDDEGYAPGAVQIRTDPAFDLTIPLTGTGGPSTADDDGDGYSAADGDCDDGRAEVHPGADEVCDGRDDDCNDAVPDDEADADGDGWRACDGECDDTDPQVHPEADEICDDKDSDCDGDVPDRLDEDGDGFDICAGDCDDSDADAWPGNLEVCDGADNDCSGFADDLDADGDGHTLCSDAGDCDDDDPGAYPVVVDPAASEGGTGTDEAPFATIEDALAAIDDTCRTVVLVEGIYTESVRWSTGPLTVIGVGDVVITPVEERAFVVTGGDLTLQTLTISGATALDGDGGAIHATNADVTLRGVDLTANTAAADGGAVAVSSGTLTLDTCVLGGNVAGDDGGAVSVVSGTLVDVDSVWTSNEAIQGGGLLAVSSRVTMTDSVFSANVADGDGGGIALDAPAETYLEGLELTGNTAASTGGGLSLNEVDDATGYVRNSLFTGNTADDGGGISVTGGSGSLLVANNTLVGNVAAADGGAAYLGGGVWFVSNLFAWNEGDTGLWALGDDGAWVAYNLGYATNSGVDASVAAAQDGGESLVADPEFRGWSDDGDFTNDDFGLSRGSPAVDSGPDAGSDPAGYDWNDMDGSRNDRGYGGGAGGR